MAELLFVGGPIDGETRDVPDALNEYRVPVSPPPFSLRLGHVQTVSYTKRCWQSHTKTTFLMAPSAFSDDWVMATLIANYRP